MINLHNIKTITIFGDGITANAVKKKLAEFNEFTLVAADKNPDIGIISPGLVTEEYINSYSFPIISEIELANLLFEYLECKPFFIAISGTNGKTTVTHIVAELLDIPMAGNVGIPLITYVSKNTNDIPKMISLELSSYQLEQSPGFAPDIYILLNITEDHLQRHKTIDKYTQVKISPIYRQKKEHYFIYNGQDKNIMKHFDQKLCQANKIDFNNKKNDFEELLPLSPLFGNHNTQNLLASLCAVSLVSSQNFKKKVKNLHSIPHRLEKVGAVKSIQFINDSKATNPDSSVAALSSFDLSKVILLLGGQKKEASYDNIFSIIKANNVRTVLFGSSSTFLYEELKGYKQIIDTTNTMGEAVQAAYLNAHNNDIILLSPGCASFDEYQNFEERGNAFKQFISRISTD